MKRILTFILSFFFMAAAYAQNIPVLCLAGEDTAKQGLDSIGFKALQAYHDEGFDLELAYYEKIDPENIFHYPLIIGMIGQLHSGSNPISPKLAEAIDRYVREGGAFLLIPGPSYYTALDFCGKFNKFLKKYGAKLLPETPRDPTNQKILQRVLSYRYLRTKNLKKDHPVTAGIGELWLPLDFSDNYLRTHCLELSPEWETLVSGNLSAISYPFASLQKGDMTPGRYHSSPPILAVRQYGKGKIAVFATASRYFIFDAYHWAHGSGFIMKNGGLKLMSQLFHYLCSKDFKYTRRQKPPQTVCAKGNVAVFPDKDQWLEHVCAKLKPRNCKVKYYIDCGSIYDRPYSAKRKFGYVDTPYTNWFIRWAWSEIFHATASNSRAMDIKTLQYRFDGLNAQKTYQLGIMVWAYQDEGDLDLVVAAADGKWHRKLSLPRFSDRQGPLFKVLEIPREIIDKGSLTLDFSCAKIKAGKFSSVCELWLFESGEGSADNAHSIRFAFEAPDREFHEFSPELKYFRGLIGAESNYAHGYSTILEMAAAAKKAQLDFLVFTDNAKDLDPGKLKALHYECRAVSDEKFLAVAGFSFSDRYKNRKYSIDDPQTFGEIKACVFLAPAELPAADDYGNPYNLFWKFYGGELAGGKRCAPTLLSPAANGISPFFQRFWRGFSAISFNKSGRLDNALELFEDLLSSGYGPYPRVCGKYRDSAAVTKAGGNWHNAILARNLKDLLVYSYSSMISSGPRIERCNYSFDHLREGEVGGGMLFNKHCRLLLNLKIEYEQPLEEVRIYRGHHLVRCFYPQTRYFSILEDMLLCSQGEFHVSVKAADGTMSGA